MASFPPIKRLSKEDLKDAPAWVDRLLYPLNLFMDAVYNAIAGTLTFQENIVSQRETFQLKAGATAADNTITFPLRMKVKPVMMFVGNAYLQAGNYAPIGNAVGVEWLFDGTNINITSISGLTTGLTYNFVVMFTP